MKKSKLLTVSMIFILALPLISVHGGTKLGVSKISKTTLEQYRGVYYSNTVIRKSKQYSSYKRVSNNVDSSIDGKPITPDRAVSFRAYATGDTLGYRVKKNASITSDFTNRHAVDRLNNQMTGSILYRPLFANDINDEVTASVMLNGEKGKVQYIGFRAVYTVEEYEVKMYEQSTGKLIASSRYKLHKPVHGEYALLDANQ